MQTDGRTTKLIVAFRNFANAPKMNSKVNSQKCKIAGNKTEKYTYCRGEHFSALTAVNLRNAVAQFNTQAQSMVSDTLLSQINPL
jgi:hypothetical protein